MIIKNIKIKDFRNFGELEIFPDEGINIVCGKNAQGKTNLIEAIWLFSGAKSFRGAKDSELIGINKNGAKISLVFIGQGTEKNADIEITNRRTAFFNEKKIESPALLAGRFNAIVFSPTDLNLLKEGPAVRRRFLDINIGQIYPEYIRLLYSYTKVIKQRNALLPQLKNNNGLKTLLDTYDEQVVELGQKIINLRLRYLEKIKGYANGIFKGLSKNSEELEIEYIKSYKEDFKFYLKTSRIKDIIIGSTSVGPHRDDLKFVINGLPSKSYASQGQQRSVAIALKLAGAEIINEISGEYPVALLDDVFSELDPIRQEYILNHIKNWQVFITCCDPTNIKNLKCGKVFSIEGGKLTECISI